MRTLKTLTGMAVAASMVLSGTAYAAGSQSANLLPKSAYAERGAAPAPASSKLLDDDRNAGSFVIWGLALAAFVGGIIFLVDSDDDSDDVDSDG